MSEYRVVEHPQRSPTQCVGCQSSEGPFIDLQIEVPVYGWLYLCVRNDDRPGCLMQMARLAGFWTPSQVAEASDAADELVGRIAELEGRLLAAEDTKVVSLTDLREMVKR